MLVVYLKVMRASSRDLQHTRYHLLVVFAPWCVFEIFRYGYDGFVLLGGCHGASLISPFNCLDIVDYIDRFFD